MSGAATRGSPLAVGLVGAGPWAERAYAPMLAEGPETRLAGVWARRPEAAAALAKRHGAETAETFAALLDRCEAVAFAVPPEAQADLATIAARAGKHLMLDKPLALTLGAARRLVDAVDERGVVTQLMLTHRYRASTIAFLESARRFAAVGARFAFLTGGYLEGPYATPWRREHGAVHDLGPHVFDLLEAALGPVEHLTGHGDPRRWVTLTCAHASGAVSELSLSGTLPLPQTICRLDLYGPAGSLAFDAVAASSDPPWPLARRTFAAAVRAGQPPPLDAHHGLALQELIDRALRALG